MTWAGMFSSFLRLNLIFLLRKRGVSLNFKTELGSLHMSPGVKVINYGLLHVHVVYKTQLSLEENVMNFEILHRYS
jgi:hypothetical protein